jgi:hypothetical protein
MIDSGRQQQMQRRGLKQAWLLLSAASIAIVSTGTAQAQTAPSAAPAVAPVPRLAQGSPFTFDSGKYVYLTVKLVADDARIFSGACPEAGNLLGIDFKDILLGSGKREAKITVQIEIPSMSGAALPVINLDPLTISISKPLLGTHKCEVKLEAFDFSSPLFFMGAYERQNFTVRTALYKKKEGVGVFFSDALDGVIAAVNSVSSVPVDAVVKIGAIGKLVRNAGTTVSNTSSGVDFKIVGAEDNPTTSKDWALASQVTGFPGNIVVRVQLRTQDTLFVRQGAVWTPEVVMQTSFPAKGIAGDIRAYLMDPGVAGGLYNQFILTTTIDTAAVACHNLMEQVDKIGLSARDRAVLKWALIRGHPTLADKPEIDHMQCVEGVFGLLPTQTVGSTVTPAEFVQRPIIVPQKTRPVTEVEMSSTVEGSARLAKFLKAATWPQRGPAAQRMFDKKYDYADADGIGVLTDKAFAMTSPAEWLGYQWDVTRALATNVGCYSWSGPATNDIAPGTMFGVIRFVTGADGQGRRDAVVRISFAPLPDGGPGEAKIVKFEIIANPDAATLKAIRDRHGKTCGEDDGWAPDILK